MTVVAGTKVGTNYNRALPAFENKAELGVVVPLTDYKFLRAFDVLTSKNGEHSAIDYLTTNETFGNEYPRAYIQDFDSLNIRNSVLGPSTSLDDSQGLIQLRPFYADAADSTKLHIDEDSAGGVDTLRMFMEEGDDFILARRPYNWEERDLGDSVDQNSKMTVRVPKMLGIVGHTNTLLFNIDGYHRLNMPMTDIGTVNNEFYYRFSFYFRTRGSVKINPVIEYYTNQGSLISSKTYPLFWYTYNDSETSDFRYFQIAIPRAAYDEYIPDGTKRFRICLVFATDSTGKFEMAYPVLEHCFESGITGFMYMSQPPSSITGDAKHLGTVRMSQIRTNQAFDSTRLFFSHIGRKVFNVSLKYNMINASVTNELRIIEHMNLMGYKVALRPKHPDFPPVMVGDIRITNQHRHWNYDTNDVTIAFTETI